MAPGLVLVLYAVAVGVVQFFDWSVQTAQLEQLRHEGQLVPVACGECAGVAAQVLSWMSDGRALLVFVVLVAVAVTGGLVGRVRQLREAKPAGDG